jgi:hypothetical protein
VKAAGISLFVAVFAIVAISPAWSTSSATNTARCPSGKSHSRTVTKIQSIQLDLMRRSSYNNFDGKQVATDLVNHQRLWCAAILDRLGDDALTKLRDIDENYWNADTVYVLSSGADDRSLTRLARRWHADDVYWVNAAHASQMLGTSDSFRILEIWWD